MVSRKTSKSTPIIITAVAILTAIFVGVVVFLLLKHFNQPAPEIAPASETVVEPEPEPEPETPSLPDSLNLQPVVDAWAASVSGNRSVLIYDLARSETVAEYNTAEDYNTASLYKLFVVYEGYRRLETGAWNPDDPAGSTSYTILKCLDLAIRESYSPCAETLWSKIGHYELDEIIETDYKITNSDISFLTSNAPDIVAMLKLFYEHPDFNNEAYLATMWDSFLNQPKTTYDWRQGLPSGFSKNVRVYNKVGWDYNPSGRYWNIYHDAAIISFPSENSTSNINGENWRDLILVVMTNRVDFKDIARLGQMIENAL